MSNIIPFPYQGQTVRFSVDGWINATEIAKRHGKRLDHWLENAETQRYMESLARHLNTPDSGYLIRAKRGRGGGTWLHPKLAVAFARWIDVDFGVWADMQIDALLRGDVSVRQRFEEACAQLEDRRSLASEQGRGLAQWRHEKESLERRVEYWRDQLQMTLALDAA
ncbi:KilA-N domain-containing protein [Halomonas caseinilytica]|uniref:KilA-N domain-containing protein n=1 Tax=Halomonas caseinilytica TaxID=438744 RepID=UPI0007E5A48E|nr:KilA-N domain-containing protein [Halomonas caseinilytica]SEN64738.1 ORF11CD3 domain-containing protein [Halomonas caseinilytica]